MKNTYKLTSKKIRGKIEIEFLNAVLNGFKIDFKEALSRPQFEAFTSLLPYEEHEVNAYEAIGLTVSKLTTADGMTAPQKIALFCQYYKEYKAGNPTYKASGIDGNKLKAYKITGELLKAYFTSDNFLFKNKHSVSNLVTHYNALLAEMASAGTSKYPDHWSKIVEGKLKPEELPGYYAHLRSLGLQVKKDRLGNTLDWVKNGDLI